MRHSRLCVVSHVSPAAQLAQGRKNALRASEECAGILTADGAHGRHVVPDEVYGYDYRP